MVVEYTPLEQQLINDLSIYYGLQVTALKLLPFGADMDASAYKVEAQDHSSYFVKLKHGHHQDVSVSVLELLYNAGIRQIIPPIKTIQGRSIQRNLIVYPFIEGQNGFITSLSREQWIALGKTLREIHEMDIPLSLQQQLRHETYSPKWREMVRTLYAQMDTTPAHNDIARQFLASMKENKKTILRLADRAEQLAQIIQNESPKFVLCHSDIHGGNVLLSKNDQLHIVDWDDPMMAPKERDLMFIGGGVGNVWNHPEEEAFFYEGYGETKINQTILAYYRCERIVEDIALFGQSLLLAPSDDKESYRHFMDMFKPNGVVDIANH